MPMGGKAGSQVEITISGENIEDADELAFSDPRITAGRKLDARGAAGAEQVRRDDRRRLSSRNS